MPDTITHHTGTPTIITMRSHLARIRWGTWSDWLAIIPLMLLGIALFAILSSAVITTILFKLVETPTRHAERPSP